MLTGCTNSTQHLNGKKGSSGKTLEMIVVANRDVYSGSTKEAIHELFMAPQMGLPITSPEPMFDVSNIPQSSFEGSEMFRVHRNVLMLDIKESNPNKVYMHIDQYSAPQVIFDFAAKTRGDLDSMLRAYQPKVLSEIYKAEHRRIVKAYKGEEGIEVEQKFAEKMGFRLTFSEDYAIANTSADFMWVRKEAKDFGMGVLVKRFAYKDKAVFEERNILDTIDSMMAKVPGPTEGSYMGVERRRSDETGEYLQPIEQKVVDFPTGTYCVETRGCWRLYEDFMGGPIVAYTLKYPGKEEVLVMIGYVYCPRNKPYTKRDLLMQMESVCYSIDTAQEKGK